MVIARLAVAGIIIGLFVALPAWGAPGDLDTLLEWLSGDFDNRAQVAAQPESDEPLYSLLGLQRRVVSVPVLGEHVVYAQINNEADPADVYRQTLMVFSHDAGNGEFRSRTVSFAEPEANADILDRLDDLASMTEDDFVDSLPAGCAPAWEWRDGEYRMFIDPDDCVITSQYTGKQRHIQGTEFVGPDVIRNEESGYRPDGSMIFGLPEGVYYVYERRD
jgi:hypothetical protein